MAVLWFWQFASHRTDLSANQRCCLIPVIDPFEAQDDRFPMSLPFGNFDGLPIAITAK
jgi:hypothetical protein